MAETKTINDPEVLAGLEFRPECDVRDLPLVDGRQTKCTHPAEWIGISPCGHDSYFCGPHHSDQRLFTCRACGRVDTHLATYRWVRL
jgi:hypothetical protein